MAARGALAALAEVWESAAPIRRWPTANALGAGSEPQVGSGRQRLVTSDIANLGLGRGPKAFAVGKRRLGVSGVPDFGEGGQSPLATIDVQPRRMLAGETRLGRNFADCR